MKALKLLAATALLAIPAIAPANAITLSGTVTQVCNVSDSATGVNLADPSLQRVATIEVTCNKASNPNISLSATNGKFKHNSNSSFDVDYTVGFDISGHQGNNSLQTGMSNLGAGGSMGPFGLTAGTELAASIPGVLIVDLDAAAYVAGTYSETLTFSIG